MVKALRLKRKGECVHKIAWPKNTEKEGKVNNLVFSRSTSSCRLCSYAGFSNNCDFFQTGKCPYVEFKKDVGRNRRTESNGK